MTKIEAWQATIIQNRKQLAKFVLDNNGACPAKCKIILFDDEYRYTRIVRDTFCHDLFPNLREHRRQRLDCGPCPCDSAANVRRLQDRLLKENRAEIREILESIVNKEIEND